MIKKEIYPKTKRLSLDGEKVQITEKLDGSNLCIFKSGGIIYVAQRNNIISEEELELQKDMMYKGLYGWLCDYLPILKEELLEKSAICGEWLGMGKLKYDVTEFNNRFYMFAKANIDYEFNLKNLSYNHEFFIYPFKSKTIPNFIGVVPVVAELTYIPNKESLDKLYNKYKTDRNVEGFVVNRNDNIVKYVRMKNGKLEEHYSKGE